MEENVNTVCHKFLKEDLSKNMISIDATMGRGNDTYFLANLTKKVYAFDIQQEALDITRKRCKDLNNIHYFLMSHSEMKEVIKEKVDCIIFNLGYLPYSDETIITESDTTLKALNSAYDLLKKDGILSVLCYIGHKGGKKEHETVKNFIASHSFEIKTYTYKEKEDAPILYYLKKKEEKKMIIKNGLIHDAINKEPYVADILVKNGKIVKIEKDLVTKDEEIIDASGKDVYPGFVDAHAHIGLDGYGIGFERQDYNEMGDIISPQLRGIDGINPFDPTFEQARNAGITSVCTGPGSANVLGGTFTAIKTAGTRVEDMIIKKEVAMKCAFGENPKRCYRDKGNSARMTTAANLRKALFEAKDYMLRKEAADGDITKMPPFDMKKEALIPVLKKEIPLKAHAHAADDMFTAIRIAKEFDVKLTLEHCTEGHLIAEALVKENYPMAVGPTLTHASKFELKEKSWETPKVLSDLGGLVSIITDSPVIPEQYLPLCAGLAIKAGMDPFKALQAITINPAKHIGIADRVGSLEVKKDADILITSGNIFDVDHTVHHVIIDGKCVK